MATNALNRIEPVYYRVVLTGFDVDPVSPENHSSQPTTGSAGLLIERANMRWEAVVRGASTTIQPLFTASFTSVNRTADVPEDDLEFTLTYDRPEYLDTEDESAAPARLTGVDAVKRLIARELIQDVVENRQIYDPTVAANIPQIIEVTAVKAAADISTAEAGIAVTEIANLDDKP